MSQQLADVALGVGKLVREFSRAPATGGPAGSPAGTDGEDLGLFQLVVVVLVAHVFSLP